MPWHQQHVIINHSAACNCKVPLAQGAQGLLKTSVSPHVREVIITDVRTLCAAQRFCCKVKTPAIYTQRSRLLLLLHILLA